MKISFNETSNNDKYISIKWMKWKREKLQEKNSIKIKGRKKKKTNEKKRNNKKKKKEKKNG